MKTRAIALTILLAISNHAAADSIRTSGGVSCSNNVNDQPFELKTYTETARGNDYGYQVDEVVAGIELSYKFGNGIKSLDCNTLYQLELTKLRTEIEMLRDQQAVLKAVQQTSGADGGEW
ncbi:hypothetical protein [Vibrio sp. WXL210]|uniref:hypothetical protein n=1 Tax=Vibrio sp. WXL210 TaxID=3450709 RepID=UPI003EC737C4